MSQKSLDRLSLFTGRANLPLAEEICQCMNVGLGKAVVKTFSDGEVMVEIGENVRGKDVFVVQPTCPPVNHNLMELLIMMDALRRASAQRITAVVPYYGYARQDRKVAPRVPISAKLTADLITAAGAKRVLAMDLHAGQIQGFFNIPVDHLFAAPVLLSYIREHFQDNVVMVSPDAGGVERARAYARRLDADLAIIDKRREGPNEARVMHIIGDVAGRNAIILDDMVDTAGTLTQAAMGLAEAGARKVYACATHPVLSGPAIERIVNSPIDQLIVVNTIPLSQAARQCGKITQLSVSSLLSEAIRRIHTEDSVSSLFV
ncbi:MAG: ribose-phosphate pyrophosphokinase [Pseudomonadota bacterium]